MAEFKRRTLCLKSGKQLKLYGNSLAISNGLEIGEGAAPNIFAFMAQHHEERPAHPVIPVGEKEKTVTEKLLKKTVPSVLNPHRLTEEDLQEIADYNIRLWLDFKDNLRKHGVQSPKVFNAEVLR